ncbi:arginyl-tRNA synthetase [Auricularia subglabra TFB-10046 SS5]|nr:arginyl-tRNA synthetase [Auricularia subglabra TFB-10046 SS5]
MPSIFRMLSWEILVPVRDSSKLHPVLRVRVLRISCAHLLRRSTRSHVPLSFARNAVGAISSSLTAKLSTAAHFEDLPPVPGAEPSKCFHDAVRIAIAQRISRVLPVSIEQAYAVVDYGKKDADYSVAVPRLGLKGDPEEIAARVTDEFRPDAWLESVTVAPPFLRFRAPTATLTRGILDQIDQLTHHTASGVPEYGTNDSGRGKKLVLEYSSPNIAKQFHVGHLRSTILGGFLANLYRACGWDVISLNYLGDWGKQFGLVAVGFDRYGNQEALEKDPIKHLFDVYVKINQDAEADPAVHDAARAFFKRMEDGDEQALKNWRVWRELSIKQYAQEYALLNVAFDEYVGESTVSQQSQDDAVQRLQELGITKDSDGALLVDLEQHKLGSAVLRKKDGTSLYLTRDLGGAIERWEKYRFDKMIYVVSSQQDRHLAQFFKLLALMGYEWAAWLEHVSFGLVQGMSTRKGTVVFLDEIIREAAAKVLETMRKDEQKYAAVTDPARTSLEVGISAVKIQDMQARRGGNYTFNWDRMTRFEGDTGPYLQYAHVRLASIERKNAALLPLPPRAQIDARLLAEPHARALVFLLGTYPDVVKAALRTHEPSAVITFAMRLAHSISSAWEVLPVKYEPDRDKARARLWMFICARDVLGAAMRLLTLTPLERM